MDPVRSMLDVAIQSGGRRGNGSESLNFGVGSKIVRSNPV